ncbi:MAG: hypothetical protein LBP35_06500 [Candidatus Ancillula trichonymphae]|nr:hypothetical protein [Candidatus Ancillula trichonymphae]
MGRTELARTSFAGVECAEVVCSLHSREQARRSRVFVRRLCAGAQVYLYSAQRNSVYSSARRCAAKLRSVLVWNVQAHKKWSFAWQKAFVCRCAVKRSAPHTMKCAHLRILTEFA